CGEGGEGEREDERGETGDGAEAGRPELDAGAKLGGGDGEYLQRAADRSGGEAGRGDGPGREADFLRGAAGAGERGVAGVGARRVQGGGDRAAREMERRAGDTLVAEVGGR